MKRSKFRENVADAYMRKLTKNSEYELPENIKIKLSEVINSLSRYYNEVRNTVGYCYDELVNQKRIVCNLNNLLLPLAIEPTLNHKKLFKKVLRRVKKYL